MAEHKHQLSIIDLNVKALHFAFNYIHYTVLQTKDSRSASAINQVLHEMMYALYVLWYAKRNTCQVETMSNSEKIKPVSLAVIELHLSEGISQSVGWSVGQSVSQSVGQSVSWLVSHSVEN